MEEYRDKVARCRELAERDPEAYLPDLAKGLAALATRLVEVEGESDEAYQAAQEAADIYRELAKRDPDTFLTPLAEWLVELADLQGWDWGNDETREVMLELVELSPNLTVEDHGLELQILATQLTGLADELLSMDRPDDALKVALGDVRINSRVAEHHSAHRLALKGSFHDAIDILGEIDKAEKVLQPARELVEISRKWSEREPENFLPYLAASLETVGYCLAELERLRETFEPMREAVDIRRKLAERHPGEGNLPLAASIMMLAYLYVKTGDPESAIETCTEGLQAIAHTLPSPTASAEVYAKALVNIYRKACEKAGREPEEALVRPIVEVLERSLREE